MNNLSSFSLIIWKYFYYSSRKRKSLTKHERIFNHFNNVSPETVLHEFQGSAVAKIHFKNN